MSENVDTEDEMIAKVADYLADTLPPAEKDEVGKKIASDEAWKRTHDEMVEAEEEARKHISGLRKAPPPATFVEDVTSTIHKRSAGRFFARRTLGDRVPFGALLIVALVALCVVGYLMWSSPTGSLKVEKKTTPTEQPSIKIRP